LVSGIQDGGTIQLLHDHKWEPVPAKSIPVDPATADIAVLALPRVLPETLPLEAHESGLTLAEELYFLGFPYALVMPGVLTAHGYPIPLVKRGICSAFGPVDGVRYVFLDGLNNPGFSGGPVVRSKPPQTPVVVAVVSGFRASDDPVLKDGKATEYYLRSNTGIVLAVSIDHAVDAIKKKPVGPQVVAP
jgi:hypothetical protein